MAEHFALRSVERVNEADLSNCASSHQLRHLYDQREGRADLIEDFERELWINVSRLNELIQRFEKRRTESAASLSIPRRGERAREGLRTKSGGIIGKRERLAPLLLRLLIRSLFLRRLLHST